MSFSERTKNELSRKIAINECCCISEISAYAHVAGKIELKGRGDLLFHMHTEHSPTARCVFKLLKTHLNVQASLITKENKLKKKNIYAITIDDADESKKLLHTLKLLGEDGSMNFGVDKSLFINDCCEASFLRGCFLGSGSISDPEKGYHLEIVINSKEFTDDLLNILNDNDIKANYIIRKEKFVVYIKEGDSIIHFLTLIGAYSSVLELENIRISKELNNNINRAANCDAANFSKTVDASVRQVKAIMHLEKIGQLEKLPKSLLIVAQARLENKYATLNELVNILDNSVGKSGIKYRLKRICEISESFK